jgi:hypothetical protein
VVEDFARNSLRRQSAFMVAVLSFISGNSYATEGRAAE